MCVTLYFSMRLNTSAARVLLWRTIFAPVNIKPCIPGQAKGKLWAIGSTANKTELDSILVCFAASLELQT